MKKIEGTIWSGSVRAIKRQQSRSFAWIKQSRRVESELVAHIAEVDERRLYAREACPSMFSYGQPYPVLKGSEIPYAFGVSLDSQKFLVALETEPSQQPQINVVMGWFEELKRLAPTN